MPPVTFSPLIILSITGFQILESGGRIEGRPIFPFGRIEHPLIDRAAGRLGDGAGVLAGGRRQRELHLSRIRVIGIGIRGRWRGTRSVP